MFSLYTHMYVCVFVCVCQHSRVCILVQVPFELVAHTHTYIHTRTHVHTHTRRTPTVTQISNLAGRAASSCPRPKTDLNGTTAGLPATGWTDECVLKGTFPHNFSHSIYLKVSLVGSTLASLLVASVANTSVIALSLGSVGDSLVS